MAGLRNSFAETLITLVMHPKVFLPFAAFQGIAALASYLYVGAFIDVYVRFQGGISLSMAAWQFFYYAFFLAATPLFEGWTYYMLSVFFSEGRMSLRDGLLNALRKYPGFLGLEAIYYAVSLLISLPLGMGMGILVAGLIIARNPGLRGVFLLLGAVILISMIIGILIQALLLFMKPVYAHVGHFFESIPEGMRAAWTNFNQAVCIVAIVTVWGVILSIPSILFLVDLIAGVTSFSISPLSIQLPLWFFVHMACVGLLTRLPLACASTHYYLTRRGWMP